MHGRAVAVSSRHVQAALTPGTVDVGSHVHRSPTCYSCNTVNGIAFS